jgi:hypothetical protein
MKTLTFTRKVLAIFIMAICFLFASKMTAQTIQIDSTFTSDGEIFPFEPNDTIYGLSISGHVTLSSDTSLVRVILTDNSGNEWMVYEAYPMIVTDSSFDIEEVCDETCYLEEFYPHSLKIQIIDAIITISDLSYSLTRYQNLSVLQQEAKRRKDLEKVQFMNQYIASKDWEWVADTNYVTNKFYYERTILFGDKYQLFGWEFYSGGSYYSILSDLISDNSDRSLISSFDWRDKHDARDPKSLYYIEDEESPHSGWLTGIRQQGDCESCSAFACIAALEAAINLYSNCQFDILYSVRFSEKDAFNCSVSNSGGGQEGCSCDSGKEIYEIFENIINDSIVNEECFPYEEPYCEFESGQCAVNSTKCDISDWLASICGRVPLSFPENEDPDVRANFLKEKLLTYGPIVVNLHLYYPYDDNVHHAVLLIGFDFNENTGKLDWIYKSSQGPGFVSGPLYLGPYPHQPHVPFPIHIENGMQAINYDYQSCPIPITVTKPTNPPFQFVVHKNDLDHDGYYNWGIGHKPTEFLCSQDEDWNDNNKHIGPHNAKYEGIPVNPGMNVKFSSHQSVVLTNITRNSFISFSSSDLYNGHELHFIIENPGNAQLNLDWAGVQEYGKVEIIDIPGGSTEFEIIPDNLPNYKICMNTESGFIIDYAGTTQGDLTKIKIHVNDDEDLPDFEFILVFNDCLSATEVVPITTNTFWDFYALKNDDYLITNGATLTITGQVAMAENSDIFVDAGAKIKIDGGRLTSSCNSLWNGIDLWGDARMPQIRDYQGSAQIINGGTIEFARCGVENTIVNGIPYTYTGGIVSAYDAVFKDNLVAVRFWPYHNHNPLTGSPAPNCSRLENSEFMTSWDLYDMRLNPQVFVQMQEVEGIYILGCEFHNKLDLAELNPGERSGVGILAYESNYLVSNYCIEPSTIPCSRYKPCRFENLEYGIWSGYITSAISARIRNSEFVNNVTGIDLFASAFSEVTQNTFEIRKIENLPFDDLIYCGLYLDNCMAYDVEENSFFTFFDERQREEQVSIGLIVNNSGEDNNDIYNNIFDGLYAGIIAQEVNRDQEGIRGLQIKCNKFTNGIFDIAVTKDPQNSVITGIAKEQGSNEIDDDQTAPAGNRFSFIDLGENPEPEGNYFNSCESITYWYHADANGYYIIPERHTTAPMVDPKPETQHGFKFVPEQSCPSNLVGGGPGILEQKASMISAGQNADSVQNLLSLLTDGGDTKGLLSDIQNSWPEEAFELYSGLISNSPYLSDTSMIKAIEKENVLLPGMIADVLVANPQSVKSEKVMSSVDGRANPLTEDQLADIGQGRFIIGAKESLESHHSRYLFLKDQSKSKIVRLYKADTLSESSIDSVINILSMQNDLTDEYLEAFEYLKKGDSGNVVNTLDDIPLNYNLTVAQENEYELYQDYMNLLLSLDTAGSSIFEMDSLKKSTIYQIMTSSNGRLKSMARNILIANDSLDYVRHITLPQPGLKSAKIRTWPVKRIQSENVMRIYPNPANDLVIVEIRLKNEPINASINLTDMRGITLKFYSLEKQNDYLVIPLSEFPSGNFFFQLNTNNITTETRKLIIAK